MLLISKHWLLFSLVMGRHLLLIVVVVDNGCPFHGDAFIVVVVVDNGCPLSSSQLL